MNNDMEKKYQRLRSLFFGLCILAAGFLFLSASKNVLNSMAAENWPTYSGVVDGSGRSSVSALSGLYGTSLFSYSYEIEGRKYQNSRIGYGISKTTDAEMSGKTVKVYVNPEDYTDSVIVVGFKGSHLIALIFSGGFLWLGFFIWKRTK
ncbi:MAG: DUF3592 domain-containing protein [Cellvibrio sp.]|uniref:DUF3592 domain-containing protein n=1 Tax=Cellvibrio sp. TaxID=1965322 RepID=UPI0031A4DC85